MKKILNFFKTLLFGIMPSIAGGCIVLSVCYIIKNIQAITTGSGWHVVHFFVVAVIETILSVALIYELGELQINANNWKAYKRSQAAQTIDSSSCDCETSDEAADT